MSEQEDDFATMFEASVKARQFDRGQTIEGTIVAFGPKVPFVNVGGKGEAQVGVRLKLCFRSCSDAFEIFRS